NASGTAQCAWMSTVLTRLPLTTTSRRRPCACAGRAASRSQPTNTSPASAPVVVCKKSRRVVMADLLWCARRVGSAVEPGGAQAPAVVVAEVGRVVLEGALPHGDVRPRGKVDVVLLPREVSLDLVNDVAAGLDLRGAPLLHEQVVEDRIVDVAPVPW